jgi:hypothetical protein
VPRFATPRGALVFMIITGIFHQDDDSSTFTLQFFERHAIKPMRKWAFTLKNRSFRPAVRKRQSIDASLLSTKVSSNCNICIRDAAVRSRRS